MRENVPLPGRKPATSDVVVLCWGTPSGADRRALKIAEFVGAQGTLLCLDARILSNQARIGELALGCRCLIAAAETVAKLAAAQPNGIHGAVSAIGLAEHVLIYGFEPAERHNQVLRALSSGGIQEAVPIPSAGEPFHVTKGRRERCGQLSGVSLGQADSSRDRMFVESGNAAPLEVLIRTAGNPFFVGTNMGGSQIFLLACDDFADLDEKVYRGSRRIHWFSRFIPLMMFLRGALRERVWHGDRPRACFIIDDPLLKTRYGFLNYTGLFKVIQKRRFAACIAFIPWNYRRTSRKMATVIASNYKLPFLCVHGCDHTDGEFATHDAASLQGKAKLALERMRAHQQLSGIAFDDVMVFPQGRFSVEAVNALKAAGYLAAVNGDVVPGGAPEAERLALRDLLDVAVTRFADFPLFGRRYPRDELGDFALDLYLGKPAFAVEHHGYFRNGYRDLETFVEQLNSLDDRLEWANLATVCSGAYLTRNAANGDIAIRFYTSRFSFRNGGTETQRFVFLRQERHHGPTPVVTVNGSKAYWEREGNDMKLILSLAAGEAAEIRILTDPRPLSASSWTPTKVYKIGVLLRRILCEARDNYVEYTKLLRSLFFIERKWARNSKARAA